MGINIKNRVERPNTGGTDNMNLSTGFVWVVFRYENDQVHLQGIFDDEAKAMGSCHDDTYIIGPVPFNTSLTEHRVEWIGSYFPHKGQKE